MDAEPASANVTQDEREFRWLTGRDTGLSSLAIFSVLSRKHGPYAFRNGWGPTMPRDPSDLGRCLRLLDAVPEWRDRLSEVVVSFPEWGPLIKEWPRLAALYYEELPSRQGVRCYAAMRPLIDEGLALLRGEQA